MEKSTFVAVEVTLGSRKVGVATMLASEYVKLRQEYALGLNNCFTLDEQGIARWNALAINHYRGWDRRNIKIYAIPNMDTRNYLGRWQNFELAVCKVLGLKHMGYEMTGKAKGYIPDGIDSLGLGWEIKSRRGMYRKGQVKK